MKSNIDLIMKNENKGKETFVWSHSLFSNLALNILGKGISDE